jgi:hypothetical protein
MSPEAKKTPTQQAEEDRLTQTIEAELTDEQLTQLAEGASSWGAHCNENGGCS